MKNLKFVPEKHGVGYPADAFLQEFGSQVWHAFGEPPYLVGSALTGPKGKYRDVDVRLILDDEDWKQWGFGDPRQPNAKWNAFCIAFSILGKQMTGLPIDFQIQQQTHANEHNNGARSALGLVELRIKNESR